MLSEALDGCPLPQKLLVVIIDPQQWHQSWDVNPGLSDSKTLDLNLLPKVIERVSVYTQVSCSLTSFPLSAKLFPWNQKPSSKKSDSAVLAEPQVPFRLPSVTPRSPRNLTLCLRV